MGACRALDCAMTDMTVVIVMTTMTMMMMRKKIMTTFSALRMMVLTLIKNKHIHL